MRKLLSILQAVQMRVQAVVFEQLSMLTNKLGPG